MNFNFKNCLVKFNDINSVFSNSRNYDFENLNLYENLLLNSFPDFKNKYENELIIMQNSDAIGVADISESFLIPYDILNINRTASPDIGAYQHVIIND